MSAPASPNLGRILLADPHWVMRASLERTLVHVGAREVVVAESLTKALSMLDGVFDVVITELSLGDGEGACLVRLAKNLEPRPAIVAMAVRCRAGESMDVPEGVDTFLFKPFTSDQMLDAIRRAQVSQRRRRDEARIAPVAKRPLRYHAAKDEMLLEMVARELRNNGGSIRGTAIKLGISRTTVRRLIERSGGMTGGGGQSSRRLNDAS